MKDQALLQQPFDWRQCRTSLAAAEDCDEELQRFDRAISDERLLHRMTNAGFTAAHNIFGNAATTVCNGLFGRGLLPVVWTNILRFIYGKNGKIVHEQRPYNTEYSLHLLDEATTPSHCHFVRNNGLEPERARKKDLQNWHLLIHGEVHNRLQLTYEDLQKFPQVTRDFVIECAGNGRSNFIPEIEETSWLSGAVACSTWTGVRLRDVLAKAELKDTAVYTGHFGEDPPHGKHEPFSRGIPIEKALDENTIIAFKMNGQPLPAEHGFPVRLIVPGWIGSSMQKWLNRIWIRDKVHDSEKMSGYSYRLPAYPLAAGSKPPASDMIIATSLKIKSMITRPQALQEFKIAAKITVHGHAWAGESRVERVMISTDFGQHWQPARLMNARNRFAWHNWKREISFFRAGYYEIWSRAFDSQGLAQPFKQPWNPKGYLGNMIHRTPVIVSASFGGFR